MRRLRNFAGGFFFFFFFVSADFHEYFQYTFMKYECGIQHEPLIQGNGEILDYSYTESRNSKKTKTNTVQKGITRERNQIVDDGESSLGRRNQTGQPTLEAAHQDFKPGVPDIRCIRTGDLAGGGDDQLLLLNKRLLLEL